MHNIIEKKIIPFFILTIISTSAFSETLSQKQKEILYIMNYTHYAAYKIKNYNNILALEDEYNTLSDNLKVEVLDQNDRDAILELMDYIKEARIMDLQYKRLQDSIETKMNGAIYNTLPQVMTVFAGGFTPWMLAINAARTAGSMYMNYMNVKNQLGEEFEDGKLKLLTGSLNNMNNCSKTIFEHTWNIIHDYSLNEDWRITDNTLELLLDSLKISDPDLKYRNMHDLLLNNSSLQHFPLYWYYLAKAALDAGKNNEALGYFDRYEKENPSIFIKDEISADACKGKTVALMNIYNSAEPSPAKIQEFNKYTKKTILQLLDFIDKNSLKANECRNLYFCGMVANSMGEKEIAAVYLKRAVTKLESLVMGKYLDNSFVAQLRESKVEYNSPDAELLTMVRTLLTDAGKTEIAAGSIKQEYQRGTASLNEYLYYFGKQTTDSIYAGMLDKIKAVEIDFSSNLLSNNETVYIPIQWVINANTELTLSHLDKDGKPEETFRLILDEKAMKKSKDPDILGLKLIYKKDVKRKFTASGLAKSVLSGVSQVGDSVVSLVTRKQDTNTEIFCLTIDHPVYPVNLLYTVSRKNKNSKLAPSSVIFNGKVYEIK